jgi:hypothetical protein
MPNRCLTPISFLQEFYPEAEIKDDVIINGPNDFDVQPFLAGPHRSKPPKMFDMWTPQADRNSLRPRKESWKSTSRDECIMIF